jgi:uncharacterized lipoprotein
MLFRKNKFYLTWLFLFLLGMPCACSLNRINPNQASRTYHKTYDEVWEAVTDLILEDLGCTERTLKKNKGYLETDWVHSIDTEGQHRWKIEAYLKQHKDAVTVQLVKTVQLKGDVSNTVKRYEEKTQKDPKGPNAGWSDEAATARDIEDLYRRIDLRLGE